MEKPEKIASKSTRTREKIEPTIAEPVFTKPTLPKPVLRSDAETVKILTELLDSAPVAPVFTNIEEVTAWLDSKYNRWLKEVKRELGK